MTEATKVDAIVIGGSAGALDALSSILPSLPADLAVPIAMVLHVSPTKPSYLVGVLAARCALGVKEAEDKEELRPGALYLAPPNYHLLIERRRCFSLSVDEPVFFSRPAIDVLFESAAAAYGAGLVGVLLAGANEDGARGLARIHAAGGATLVQSPESCATRTMPEAALSLHPHRTLLPAQIGPALAALGGSRDHRMGT